MDQRLVKPTISALKQRTALPLQNVITPELKLRTVLPPQEPSIHKLKQRTVLLVVTLVALMALAALAVLSNYFDLAWTGFKGNTLSDWINVLLLPLIVLAAAKGFSTHQSEVSDTTDKQQQTDLQLAHERQQEVVLEAYLNHMSDLLLNKNLSRSQPGSDVRTIARTLTLTALQMVGKNRKGVLLQFLHEAGLITTNKTIIDLRRGDLREADLSGARLIESKVTAEQLATAMSLNGATYAWFTAPCSQVA